MQIHTYRARSLHDALTMLRDELGPDPQIVNSRELETSWLTRVARGREFEIRTRLPKSNRPLGHAAAAESVDANRLRRTGQTPNDTAPPNGTARSVDAGRRRSRAEDVPSPPHPSPVEDDTNPPNATTITTEQVRAPAIERPSAPKTSDNLAPRSGQVSNAGRDRMESEEEFTLHHRSSMTAMPTRADEFTQQHDIPAEIETRVSAANLSRPETADGTLAGVRQSQWPAMPPSDAGDEREQMMTVQPNGGASKARTESSRLSAPKRRDFPAADAAIETCDELFEVLADLVDAEVPESTARKLVEPLFRQEGGHAQVANLREQLVRRLARDVETTGPIRLTNGQQKVMALVGPTGVGKTTTIAKLAANLRLCEKRRVGLITVDTYRVAAVDQLRTYAEIMDLPMEVVSSPGDMRRALTRLNEEDVILIDTSGRSPQDSVQLHQLKSTLANAAPHEIQLVASCTASARHLQQIAQRFEPLGCTSILVTKLDEAMSLGNLVPMLLDAKLPFSYLTCGQSVPDDIVVAEKNLLIPALLGQQPIATLV